MFVRHEINLNVLVLDFVLCPRRASCMYILNFHNLQNQILDHMIKIYDFRAVEGNIKLLPNKLLVINQKTIEAIYKCKMATTTGKNTVAI